MKLHSALMLALLLIIPFSMAGEDWMYNSQYLTMELQLSSKINIIPLASNYKVSYVNANLSLSPRKDVRQEVLSLNTNPEAKEEGEFLLFRWDAPEKNDLEFSLSSKIKTKNDVLKINKKVPFPIQNLPKEYEIYTKPSKNIDSNEEAVIRLSSQLAAGEDDAYVVVNKLAEWVETNVKYSLTTLTEDVSQPSSWVLKNRYGVCDEITSLFIALTRSLGIPARFVSGVAYTTSSGLNNWGTHAWAEVYFPEYGWVPFDVTYREFGFIDPTHIALKYSLDSDESSTMYETYGVNVKLATDELKINTILKETGPRTGPLVSLDLDIEKKKIRFGSYNLIEVTVENLKNQYITTSIILAKLDEMEVIGSDVRHVVLKPNQKKKEYFIVGLTDRLKSNFIYTIPIEVYTTRNDSIKSNFEATADFPYYSLEEIEKILDSIREEEKKTYSKEISFRCESDKKSYYVNEKALVNCLIKNKGNVLLEDLKVCLEGQCKDVDLGIAQEKEVNFELELKQEIEKDFAVTAKNSQVSKAYYIPINVLDSPKIEIAEIEKPDTVTYNDKFSVTFKLKKLSRSNPKNLVLDFKNGIPKRWNIEELEKDTIFLVEMKGSDLEAGKNNIKIRVSWEDEKSTKYQEEKESVVSLENVTVFQRIAIFFKGIEKRLVIWFS